jgi:hypothetical protein
MISLELGHGTFTGHGDIDNDEMHYRFLETERQTVLILEDDTDFSLHIRQRQIPLLAAAVRYLFNTTISSTPFTNPNDYPHYWAPTST